MKVVQINPVCNASTGKIVVGISNVLDKHNIENYILYTSGNSEFKNAIKYGSNFDTKLSALLSRLFGNYGFNSIYNTRKLIEQLDKIKPDLIHLHNIHGHNVNLNTLFKYIKDHNVKTFWTFHDCWSFTGYCTHFDFVKCNKWQTKCKKCPQYRQFSWLFDRSNYLFRKKRELISDIKNLTIITPSAWLAELVKKSFFSKYPVYVINNGINLDVFRPTESDFKEKYKIENKKILLGVAAGFSKRKGFSYYIELSKIIDSDTMIILVGVNKKQIEALPGNVIGIERTANQIELAEIYTAADVFLNCTLEDNFPTVNLEALACGTPIVTFNTGGSVEAASNKAISSVVEQGDIVGMYAEAKKLIKSPDISDLCIKEAQKKYNERICFEEYVRLCSEDKTE